MTPVIVLTTVGASFDPRQLANDLVERRLAACVNIIPQLHSVYRWQGKIENDAEQMLLIKTVDGRLDELQKALFSLHPYEVPEFMVIEPRDVAEPYRAWLIASVERE
jgi:periplasmic divalent cation tolerance protein